jgi:ribosomal 30S subunit maturation factor RimM
VSSAEGAATATSDRLVVALVRGVHGLRGAVRVEILTDRPDDR